MDYVDRMVHAVHDYARLMNAKVKAQYARQILAQGLK